MSEKNYYETLGVSEDATPEEIKKAYRKEMLIWHPDRNENPEAEEVAKLLNEAYDTLGDESKRDEYDMYNSLGKYAGTNTHSSGNTEATGNARNWSQARAKRKYTYTPNKKHTYSRHRASAEGMSTGTPSWAKWATLGITLLIGLYFFSEHPIISVLILPISIPFAGIFYGFLYIMFMTGHVIYRCLYPTIDKFI